MPRGRRCARARLLIGSVLAGVCALCAPLAAQESSPSPQVLVRIAKQPAANVAPALLARLTAIEELESAWVARAPADAIAALRLLGIAVDELPTPLPGYAYYLVFDVPADDLRVLRTRGQTFPADETSWLILVAEDHVRDLVPTSLSFKHLGGARPGPVTLSDVPSPVVVSAEPRVLAASALPAELAAQVSRDRLRKSIADLEGFVSRYASTAACESAGSYLLDSFRRIGLDAAPDYFAFGGNAMYTTSNIIATLPGRVDPSRVVIVSAHYDSTSDERPAIAPGADDNASGTAAVMEAALLLAPHAFDFTVRFIAFGAEEWGLLGSQRYAQAARQRGEQVVAVLNLDMIGYADRLPEDLDIVSSEGSVWLADRLAGLASTTAALPTTRRVVTTFGSDCSPFWQQGFASVCGIDDYPLTNPYYHKATDRVTTLNMDVATAITRAIVATLADLAQPVSAPVPPTGLIARAQLSTSLFMRARTVSLEWRAGTGVAGYNVYRATASHGGYRKLNATPLRETSYGELVNPAEDQFYVITSVDASGRESNYSGETGVPRDSLFTPR